MTSGFLTAQLNRKKDKNLVRVPTFKFHPNSHPPPGGLVASIKGCKLLLKIR